MSADYASFPFKLETAVWEITLACPFRCKYCGSSGGVAREGELTTEECDGVAEQLAGLGCRRVSLIGGEVFARPDWAQIVLSLTSRGVKTCVITNGFRITDDLVTELRRVNVESVAVSLDGVGEVHDAFRHKGSYDRAIAAIEALTAANIPTSVISALRSDNAPRVAELYEVLRAYPIFAWQLQACLPMGNAKKGGVAVAFDAGEVIRFVDGVSRGSKFYVGVADNIGYFTPEEGRVRGTAGAKFSGCSAGLTTVGIDSVGNVRGCESMYDPRFTEGNLRERTLLDIWTDPDAFVYNRRFDPSMLSGKCAGCDLGDVCAGGCRSYDYFTTGKLYENPLCARL